MCGIACVYNFRRFTSLESSKLAKLSDRFLRVRGPDRQSYCLSPDHRFFFYHSHLRLSHGSDRVSYPIVTSQHIFVFNGEIYNYRYLASNYELPLASDGEVLLSLIEKVGLENAVSLIEGMYAFVILDINSNQLFAITDRFSEKPLFYAKTDHQVVFSSSSVLISELIQRKRLDLRAVSQFVSLGFNQGSLFDGVKKMPQRTVLRINYKKQPVESSFIYPMQKNVAHPSQSYSAFRNQFISHLDNCMEAHSPVALLLSGGIDSSTILSTCGSSDLTLPSKAYLLSNGLSSSGEHEANAVKLARKYKVDIEEIPQSLEDLDRSFDDLFVSNALAEPLGDSSLLSLHTLMRKIKSDGFRCAIGGDGADEMWAGYKRHLTFTRVTNPPFKALTAKLLRSDQFKKIISLLKNQKLMRLSSISDLNALYLAFFSYFPIPKATQQISQLSDDHFLTFDREIYLPENILYKGDTASMANSIELRTPFLKSSFMNTYSGLIERRATEKRYLKNILVENDDKFLINSPKQGFTTPVHKFLQILLLRINPAVFDNFVIELNSHLDQKFPKHSKLVSLKNLSPYYSLIVLFNFCENNGVDICI